MARVKIKIPQYTAIILAAWEPEAEKYSLRPFWFIQKDLVSKLKEQLLSL